MKKGITLSAVLIAFSLLCTLPVQAWQGRMNGMGEASGLVEDESDFLVHPATIAGGKGLNFYGNLMYRQAITDKYSFSSFYVNPTDPTDWYSIDNDASGTEHQYEGLTGIAFPLGTGRMGLFFQYTGLNGELNGDTLRNSDGAATPTGYGFDQDNRLDNFALRLLYGMPLGNRTKLGAEFQIAYRKEKSKTFLSSNTATFAQTNAIYGYDDAYSAVGTILNYGIPFDSRYYEASLKGSVETMIGPAKAAFTLRGGIPFSSKNKYYYDYRSGSNFSGGDLDGKVKGFNVGADAWVRLPVNTSLSLPFLVKFDYKKITRDADGQGFGTDVWFSDRIHDQETREKSMAVTAGGGVDYTPAKNTKIAGGLYYSYLYNKAEYQFDYTSVGATWWNKNGHDGYPETKEHRISMKVSAEKTISSDITLNGGLNAFYGWMKQDYDYLFTSPPSTYSAGFSGSQDGTHWGLGASIGAAIIAGATTIEPFITGGLERLNLSGDGIRHSSGVINASVSAFDTKKKAYFVGAGLAVRF